MVTFQIQHGVQIIALDGVITARTIPQLPNDIHRSQCNNFIINLHDVSLLDSAGVAWMVSILKLARQRGGKAIVVWSKSNTANRIIRFTQFDKIFTMATNLDIAIQLV